MAKRHLPYPLEAIRELSAVILLGLLLAAGTGCSSESPGESTAGEAGEHALPAEVAPLLQQAQRAYQRGSYREALAATDSVRHIAPEQPELYFLRGRIFSELKQFDRAEEAYKEALSLNPDQEGLWLNLGNNAMRQTQYRSALDYYRREAEQSAAPLAYAYMGRAYAEMGKMDSARQVLHRSLAVDSTNARTHAYLGQVYKNDGQLEKALLHSQRALQLAPDNTDYRYVVGSQLLQLDRPAEAVRTLKPVLDRRPWHHGALYNLGQALTRLGREDKAASYFARADSAQKLEARIGQLRETARINPRRMMPWVNLGRTLYRAGRLAEARTAFQQALFLDPKNLALQNNVANLAHDLGRTEEAIHRYRAILEQDPTLADVWVNLGIVYVDAGRPQQARRAWQQALQYDPDHSAARTYLAHLEDSLTASPTHP